MDWKHLLNLLPVLYVILGVLLTAAISQRRSLEQENRKRESLAWLYLCEIQRNFQSIADADFKWEPNILLSRTAQSLKACDLRTEIYESYRGDFSLFPEEIIQELYQYYQKIRKLNDYKTRLDIDIQGGVGKSGLSKDVKNLAVDIGRLSIILHKLINESVLGGKSEKLGLHYSV